MVENPAEYDKSDWHDDQDNVPVGKYRSKSGDYRFAPGNQLNGSRAGIPNESTPWFDGNVTQLEIDRLKSMRRDELEALMIKLGGIVGYALKSQEEIDEAMRLKLAYSGLTENQVHKYLPAIKEYYDRTKGKPAQSIALNVKQEAVSTLTSDQLAALLAQLPNEPMVIPPMPKRDE